MFIPPPPKNDDAHLMKSLRVASPELLRTADLDGDALRTRPPRAVPGIGLSLLVLAIVALVALMILFSYR